MDFDEGMRERVALAVRARRAELGLSQEEVAARSAGMISTANVRVVEGRGRRSFRARSLVGLARALDWPDDAVERLANGEPPASLPIAEREARPASVPLAAGIELATRAELDDLRRSIAELARRVDELTGTLGADGARPESDRRHLVAAHGGRADEIGADGDRRTTPPRVGPSGTA